MRIIRAFIIPVITLVLVFLLDRPAGSLPALGRLLDPVNGWGGAAEDETGVFEGELVLKGIRQPVTVWMEGRMVPHIIAGNEYDLYFTQGYIHARLRLWQMDMQTRAAAGRISEVAGEKALEFDRLQRRKGMVYGAENSLKAIESDPRTRQMLDAYTAGVNSFIGSVSYAKLPVEYKLMGFAPEPWTNIKSALLLKYMADDLTGYTEDIQLTVLKDLLPAESFEQLFPQRIKDSNPVIPEATAFEPPTMQIPQTPGDSVWAHLDTRGSKVDIPGAMNSPQTSDGVGSNNWAISGSQTLSGSPILCNDPHLGLNLPSLWFEIQLQSPEGNC
ncbi:MAG: penicillin acylase family protein, partial [Sphingobacteriales bacterium]